MRTINQLRLTKLRKEIILGSIFYNDYKNSLNIDEKIVCNFFDGYLDYLTDTYMDDYMNMDYYDFLKKYDNIDTLLYYFEYGCSDYFYDYI